MSPIEFQGQKWTVKVTMDKYGYNYVKRPNSDLRDLTRFLDSQNLKKVSAGFVRVLIWPNDCARDIPL